MEKNNSDEIDLLQLCASFFAALNRNMLLSISFPLAGVIVALAIAYNSQNRFESSLLIETSLLTENESKFLFDQLDKFGVIPGLTKEQDDQVAGFKFEVIKNEVPNFDENTVYLQVTARVFNKDVFPLLQKALIKFINGSTAVVRHRREREKFYTEMITRIEQEIASMDEIKQQINSKIQATYLNPAELYANTVKLHEEKTKYELKLNEIKTVHLAKGFDSLTIDAQMPKVLVALIGFTAGFMLLCFVLFLKFFAKYYKLYETNH